MQKGRVKYLDGIRILSSVVVCVSHAIEIFLMPKLGIHHWLIFAFKYAASTSVVIFFVLSGFMVTNSIFNNQRRNGKFKFLQYWKDRLIRLYPPLIFAVGLCLVLYKIILIFNLNGATNFRMPNELNLSRDAVYFSYHELLYSLFFVQGFIDTTMWLNGPLWSLGEEFVLYVIASFISIMLMNRKVIIPLIVLLVIFVFIHYTGHLKNCYYLYSIWGLGAFLSIEQNRNYFFISKKIEILIALFSLGTLFGILYYKHFELPEVNYQISSFALLQASFIIAVIYLFRISSPNIKNLIQLGLEKITPERDYTYTLYIIHFPIFIFIFSIIHSWTNVNTLYAVLLPVSIIVISIIILSKHLACILENKKYVLGIISYFSSKILKQ